MNNCTINYDLKIFTLVSPLFSNIKITKKRALIWVDKFGSSSIFVADRRIHPLMNEFFFVINYNQNFSLVILFLTNNKYNTAGKELFMAKERYCIDVLEKTSEEKNSCSTLLLLMINLFYYKESSNNSFYRCPLSFIIIALKEINKTICYVDQTRMVLLLSFHCKKV